jgi:hypothetical protein
MYVQFLKGMAKAGFGVLFSLQYVLPVDHLSLVEFFLTLPGFGANYLGA